MTASTMTESIRSAGLLSERVHDLDRDLASGQWVPTALERRIAEILVIASAGDGELTAPRIRAAVKEGAESFLRENDGRLAALLGDLFPAVSGPQPAPLAAVAEAQTLLARIADRDRVRSTGSGPSSGNGSRA
jgi:hypothetical protein